MTVSEIEDLERQRARKLKFLKIAQSVLPNLKARASTAIEAQEEYVIMLQEQIQKLDLRISAEPDAFRYSYVVTLANDADVDSIKTALFLQGAADIAVRPVLSVLVVSSFVPLDFSIITGVTLAQPELEIAMPAPK